MPWIRSHLSFANVISMIALFVALGGTSYAAFGVPINSVGSAQLRNGAIPSSKLTLGNKNYLRLGFGAPAAAILARPVLAGSQTVAPNTSPGQQLSGNNTQYNQTADAVGWTNSRLRTSGARERVADALAHLPGGNT